MSNQTSPADIDVAGADALVCIAFTAASTDGKESFSTFFD